MTGRSAGRALVTRESSSSRAAVATWSTAWSKAIWFAFEGRVKPLSLRTNCREEARTSSSVAGGLKLCSVLMARHMTISANLCHPPTEYGSIMNLPSSGDLFIIPYLNDPDLLSILLLYDPLDTERCLG
jgi:hypothetical protein